MAFGDYGAIVLRNGKRVPSGRSYDGSVHCTLGHGRQLSLFKGYLFVGKVCGVIKSIPMEPGETRKLDDVTVARATTVFNDPVIMALEFDGAELWSAVSGYGIGPEATQWHPIRQKVKTLFALYELAKFKGEWADRLG